ncbi:MAG TPA: PH domain-containing protein [Thermoplasmata archaeon]|nr:PH domain-containing protein [Thermoplasmata archaeon]
MPTGASATTASPVRVFVRPATQSLGVVGLYSLLIVLMLYVYYRGDEGLVSDLLAPFLVVVLLVYLARYSTTRYRIDDRSLRAQRLFGSRTLQLDQVRRIQRANLRTLGAVGFLGTWGWRGRVWSPMVGNFDTVHTVSDGLLIAADGVPVFISPIDPDGFQQELSRRVRSVNGGDAPEMEPVA